MWAASEDNAEAARLLVQAGADVHARSAGGFSALLFAVRGGHLAATGALVDAGARIDETLPDGTSALALAITNAHFELAAALLDRGADPNAAAQGWTPLHQLVWTRRPNATLADPPAVPTGAMSSLELAQRLLARGADPNARMKKERNLGLEDRTLLNRIGATPFLLAAQTADVPLMRLLAAGGANPALTNVDGTDALMAAAGVGIWVVGENPGTNEEALEAVDLALELGGQVTAVNDFGYTALHGAAHRGAPAIVQRLVERGGPLDARLTKTGGGPLGWKEGWTPLTIATGVFYANTFKRSPETAELLRRLMRERNLPL
jgi:ankyrin repeat protein